MFNLKSERVKTIIVILIFIAVWVWDISFACKYGETYLDADMASEMVLANKSNQDGVYLDTDWYYSSEIRILGQIILFKPLLLLFPNNWGLVRVISQALFLLATGLSYVYMTSILGTVRKSIFFAAILLCPFGYWHLWHDCFDGFYLIWIIFYSFLAGVIFRLMFGKGKNKRIFQWIIMLVLSFVCGLQSIRVSINLLIPMLIVMTLIIYGKLKENSEKLTLESFRPLLITVASCMSSAMGYWVNCFCLSRFYTYANQNVKQWQDFSFSRIIDILGYFIQIFGYPYNYGHEMQILLFSKCGILSCFGFILMLIFVGAFITGTRKIRMYTEKQRVLFLTAIMSIVVCTSIFALFTDSINGSYFLPSMGLYVAALQIVISNGEFKKRKYGVVIAMAVVFAAAFLSGVVTQRLFIKYPTRSKAEMVDVANALKEQGYTQAIASDFWNGNTITELSDGSVEVWVADGMNLDNINEWLQVKSHLTTRPHDKYAYVYDADIYYDDESIQSFWNSNDNARVVYQDNVYVVMGAEE